MSNEMPIHIEAPMLSIGELQLPPPKDWEKFEKLIRDLHQAELRDLDFQLHGRSGQRQYGVDSYGWSASLDGWVGIQCKLKDRNLGRLPRPVLLADEWVANFNGSTDFERS